MIFIKCSILPTNLISITFWNIQLELIAIYVRFVVIFIINIVCHIITLLEVTFCDFKRFVHFIHTFISNVVQLHH